MFRRIVGPVVLCSLVLAACSQTGEEVPTQTHLQGEYLAEDGTSMRYLVWLPEGYGDSRDKQHPLILFLHGSGDEEYDSEFVTSFGLPATLELGEEPDSFDFVVISPQAAPGSAWWTGGQMEVIDELLQEMLDTYLVDANRVYLTGLSMGGYGSWYLASTFPERYAAMASTSGSAYQSAELPPRGFTCRLAEVPVWGIHGEQDLIASFAVVEGAVRDYESLCDTTVKWTAYPGAGHFETYERAYRDPALYNWMLSHTRSGT
jgi:predicted peptidase